MRRNIITQQLSNYSRELRKLRYNTQYLFCSPIVFRLINSRKVKRVVVHVEREGERNIEAYNNLVKT
jgi:hypothetical protein